MPALTTNALLDAALEYAQRGWHVFPCHTPTGTGCSCRRPTCSSVGKHPRLDKWDRQATTDEATIRRWWGQQFPTANIGIATGAVSGLAVLDVDSYAGGDDSLTALERTHRPLPETVEQLTGGGGRQLLFAHPGKPVGNRVRHLGAGLDTRGDGGLIIAPPSLHLSGRHYVWELTHLPEDTPLAPYPEWLYHLGQAQGAAEALDVSQPIADGARNATLFSVGCGLRARGLTQAVILAALTEMNATQCQPPLLEEEVRQVAESCAKYAPGSSPTTPPYIRRAYREEEEKKGVSPSITPRDPSGHEAMDELLIAPRLVPPPPLTPPLPPQAQHHPELAEGAAPWLDAYLVHSRTWAPRAAQGFHMALGLWVLSTIAARRICVHLGAPKFPMLFLALVAPSSLYTKTTTAHIGRKALTDAGCGFLLTPDRITPQALIRRMSGKVEDDYGDLDATEQAIRRRDLAFAGQRGWYYEEWGTMLHQIRRSDSVMAEFHGMLKVLDDGSDDFSNETILRGLEYVKDPSLALMGSATPADLAPFMRPGTPWWRDGFWARFAFITPSEAESPSLARQPRGLDAMPSALITALHTWHLRLGIPGYTVEQVLDQKRKPTGRWKGKRAVFPPQVLAVPDDVLDAYQAYNDALMTLVIQGVVGPDLSACYARYHEKALRIALLLASLSESPRLELRHWVYAQAVVETWRAMLHTLLKTAAESEPISKEQAWEERIEALLGEAGAMTSRELQRKRFRCTSYELQRLLASMVNVGRIVAVPKGKTLLYMLPLDAPPDLEDVEDTPMEDDVPF